MGLSSRILDLLNVLDYPEARIEYFGEHFQDMVREQPLFPSKEEAAEDEAIRDMIRRVTSALVKEKIEPARGSAGGISLNPSEIRRKDSLENLIDSARFPDGLAAKAHSIRNLGNKSVHKSGCGEPDALRSIRDTGEVLSHLYGRTPMSG